MGRKVFLAVTLPIMLLTACNNAGKNADNKKDSVINNIKLPTPNNPEPDVDNLGAGGATITYTVESKTYTLHVAPLVTTDKQHLSPGNDYMAVLQARSTDTSDKNAIVLNFDFALKAGTYPIVGYSYTRKNWMASLKCLEPC
jgi:hypothetical protein